MTYAEGPYGVLSYIRGYRQYGVHKSLCITRAVFLRLWGMYGSTVSALRIVVTV